MKKLLSLLTVFMLALSLAIPVGAISFNGVELPAFTNTTYPNRFVYSASNGNVYYAITDGKFVVSSNDLSVHVAKTGNSMGFILYKLNGSEWTKVNGQSGLSSATLMDGDKYIYVDTAISSNVPVYSSGGGDVPYYEPVCDGSSCPASDVNFDDICDDCGMPLAYNLRVTPNTYEVVVKHSDSLTVKYSYTETLAGTSFDAVYSDNRIVVSFDNPVNHYQFKLVDGEWIDYASYPNQYGTHTISLSGDASILASDMDIYDANGDLFFQNPLWMTVEKVTQGEMTGLAQETAGTMKVLVLSGVGLMALLVVLSLFGKRSLIFLR